MTWREFNEQPINFVGDRYKLTEIECPKCGKKIYYDSGVILTSYPAKYYYWCRCGWSDYSAIKWQGKEQEENRLDAEVIKTGILKGSSGEWIDFNTNPPTFNGAKGEQE